MMTACRAFRALQHRSRTRPDRIVYYAFDLLQLDGRNLMARPIEERRDRLAAVVHESGVLLSQPLAGELDDIIEAARRLKLEGLVAKRLGSRYEPGERSTAWQKMRLNRSQEFVVGGYNPGNPFDASLVGYYNDAGALLFAARVRAGFTTASRRSVFRRFGTPLDCCPFANLPMGKHGGWNEGVSVEDMNTMTWVAPELVVQVAFVEWTDYGLLRHASYLGIREDKDAADVRREGG
jgi:ATP-dependent DNA ligase